MVTEIYRAQINDYFDHFLDRWHSVIEELLDSWLSLLGKNVINLAMLYILFSTFIVRRLFLVNSDEGRF